MTTLGSVVYFKLKKFNLPVQKTDFNTEIYTLKICNSREPQLVPRDPRIMHLLPVPNPPAPVVSVETRYRLAGNLADLPNRIGRRILNFTVSGSRADRRRNLNDISLQVVTRRTVRRKNEGN